MATKEESVVGNINALREWTRRYFYTKQDINYFITKLDEGLKGYALMIIGPRNKKVTINPGNYQFTLNSDGWYRYLFFFNRNQEITISIQDGDTITYQLDAYNDTICLSPWVIATPAMWNDIQPSGLITYTNKNKTDTTPFSRQLNVSHEDRASTVDRWVCYEFPEETVVYKAEIVGLTAGGSIVVQGSQDGVHWVDLCSADRPTSGNITCYIDDPEKYLIYRLYVKNVSGWMYLDEIYYYTIDQATINYTKVNPNMTSNTAPSGYVVSATGNRVVNGTGYPFQAFNGDYGSKWIMPAISDVNNVNQWIQLKIPDAKIIRKIFTWTYNIKQFKLQGSNDGTNYVDLATCDVRHANDKWAQPFYINNYNSYLYYRFYVTKAYDTYIPGFDQIDLYEES